jgi:hypothetical protein
LLAVVSDSALPRTPSGKISLVTTHASGPHVDAKKKIKMQINAMAAFCAAKLSTMMLPAASWSLVRVPSMATMKCDTHMPTAPHSSSGRRPQRSIAHSPGSVDTTLMLDVII